MAIARIFDGKGWTTRQYDELMEQLVGRLGLDPGQAAPGVRFHWASETEDGMRAVDVYDSVEAADALVNDHIGPIAAELGLPLPEIQQFEVRRFLAG